MVCQILIFTVYSRSFARYVFLCFGDCYPDVDVLLYYTDRSPDIDVDSEDDDNEEDPENWSNDELSDSEPTLEETHSRQRNVARSKVRPAMNRVSGVFNIMIWVFFHIRLCFQHKGFQ